MCPSDCSRTCALADRVLDPRVPLAPQRGAGALGRGQLAQLLERDAEQLAQAEQLLQALEVLLAVGAVRAGLALSSDASRPISS